MASELTFSEEVSNMMRSSHGNPIRTCIQCGSCSGSCPVAKFMDHTPRRLIEMIRANLKDEVLASNTYWFCASCYACTARCPRDIDITKLMYGLKRYSMWKHRYREGLVGPVFSETFVKMILRTGRSYEPVLAPAYMRNFNLLELLQEAQTATSLLLKGRMPVLPPRIKRLDRFREVVKRVFPLGEKA